MAKNGQQSLQNGEKGGRMKYCKCKRNNEKTGDISDYRKNRKISETKQEKRRELEKNREKIRENQIYLKNLRK